MIDKELIDRLAREAGIEYEDLTLRELREGRVRFAALIAEECAKVCDETDSNAGDEYAAGYCVGSEVCARAIRAKFAP